MSDSGEMLGLVDLADSVLDGGVLDWDAAESQASARRRGLVRQLRLLAAMADAHRSLSAPRAGGARRPTLALPARWGPLDVIEHVGRGSFGDVYRAWDPRLDRHVALKLIPVEFEPADTSSAIIGEGRVLARVRHPNVVTIHGADRIDGCVGLWMEFVRGVTLEQLLAERGAFGWQEALLVGIDLCRALSAVHKAGVIHRDIKAQNVLREEGGRLVLMDFGTGRAPTDNGDGASLSGTPLYMAPELFTECPPTPQSDIYSLGVLIFHLATRSYPITGRTVGDVRRGHRDGRRVWLRDLRPDLPEQFGRALEPALAREPGGRYQSAGAMERALLGALAGTDRPVAAPQHTTAAAVLPAARMRPSLMWVALTAAVTMVVAVLISGLNARRQTGEAAPARAVTPAAAAGDELTARRITMPPLTYIGRPSPDGRYLSFVDLNGDLAVKDLTTGQVRQITNKGASNEGAESQIAVSPDGRWLAYTWRTLDSRHELRVVGEDGTWPRVLFQRGDVTFPAPLQWSADGTQVLTLLELGNGTQQLVLIEAATGAVRQVRRFDGGRVHAALSPDGQHVVFDQAVGESGQRDLLVAAVGDPEGDAQPLVAHPAADVFPIWTADGRVLFVSDRTGSPSLWAVAVTAGHPDGEPELLVRDIGRVATMLGPTAPGALYSYVQNGMVDVFTQAIDLATGRTSAGPERLAPLLVGSNISSAWSPDGRFVAYVSMRGFSRQGPDSRVLTIHEVATGRQVDLQPALNFFIAPRWSPDGRRILVRGMDRRGRDGLFAIDIASGRSDPAVIFAKGAVRSASIAWAPDGRAVWYDNSDARAIVAHDLESGRERFVLEYGASSILRIEQGPGFRVSPDGRAVAYTGFTFDDNKAGTVVRVHSVEGNVVEIARAASPQRVEFQDWLPDGTGVLLMKRHVAEKRHQLVTVRLDGSEQSFGLTSAMREVSLRPDGSAITYTAGASTFEVWVHEHLFSAAARSVR